MNPSKPWECSPRCNISDLNDVHVELNRICRALCTVTRAYNQAKKELEDIKNATGFYDNPFPFLHLPREVRDQIYEYAFIASAYITAGPRPNEQLGLHPLASKPPTPGLCLVNKQIHSEGIEILYGKNTFTFKTAGDLVRFEEDIGPNYWNLVRSLDFSILVVLENTSILNPDLAIPQDWSYFPTHWAKALNRSGLSGIVEMKITVLNPDVTQERPVTMCPVLQKAIEEILRRNPDGKLTTRLELIRFSETEKDKFPSIWEVRVEPWDYDPNSDAGCRAFFD